MALMPALMPNASELDSFVIRSLTAQLPVRRDTDTGTYCRYPGAAEEGWGAARSTMRHAAQLRGLRALARPPLAKVVRPHATAAAPAVVTSAVPVNAGSTGHTPTIDAPFEGSFNVEGAPWPGFIGVAVGLGGAGRRGD